VNYIVVAGETAKLGRIWPHMLRHGCDKGTNYCEEYIQGQRFPHFAHLHHHGTLDACRCSGHHRSGVLYDCERAWPPGVQRDATRVQSDRRELRQIAKNLRQHRAQFRQDKVKKFPDRRDLRQDKGRLKLDANRI
jgi:hypothetical protein